MPKEKVIEAAVLDKVSIVQEYLDKLIEWTKEFTPKFIFALLTLVIGLWLIKRISIISQKAMSRRNLDVSLRTFLKSLISIGLKIILIVMVAGMIGFQTTSLVTILGAAGLAVGLALQGSLSNFAGGVLILIFKPYKVGDFIETQGQKGEVLEIQIFNTILLTIDHRTIILPNGSVSNGSIINLSRHGDLRVEIEMQVSQDHSLDELKKLILPLLENDERVVRTFLAPTILITAIVPNGYKSTLLFYARFKDKPIIEAQMIEKVNDLFRKNFIKDPAPVTLVKQL